MQGAPARPVRQEGQGADRLFQSQHVGKLYPRLRLYSKPLARKYQALAALSIRYSLRCAREVDPDISIPDIKDRRCKNDDAQDFPRKFYQCWNRLLDTDQLLTRVGFSNEDLGKFRDAAVSDDFF
ncbi:hypothetical protein HPB48_011351 [Haemaphysalis longicornis]|uniref:Uncharacterized protein n=1 Tax=Haemaphysalis longicornis TaxID=44386 RepID=A0A9J6GK06_HAELO|nr:hypothetical protein HPB48_011351 [Haemaphysalis longicornis]